MPGALAFGACAAAAALMGFAIQRGGTCTVAAIAELIEERRATRLLAIGEAALWVAGGLALMQAAHLLPAMPPGHALGGWTVAGGLLLGIGAFVNRACVFGAVARFGSGEWAYFATPAGFFAGCAMARALVAVPPSAAPMAEAASPVLAAAGASAAAFAVFAAWRLARAARGGLAGIGRRVWAPHAATVVIGLTFLATMLLAGAWAYTDVLAELAHGMADGLAGRGALLLALWAGALWGGWTAGRFRSAPPTAAGLLRCFAGGLLMGCGSLLIPGGNDGLILTGMPLLRPYAWVAFGSMCAAIAAALLAGRARQARKAQRGARRA